MRSIVRGAIVLVACLSCTPSAWAQDARHTIDQKVRPGDKLTITTRDGVECTVAERGEHQIEGSMLIPLTLFSGKSHKNVGNKEGSKPDVD